MLQGTRTAAATRDSEKQTDECVELKLSQEDACKMC